MSSQMKGGGGRGSNRVWGGGGGRIRTVIPVAKRTKLSNRKARKANQSTLLNC